MRKKNRDINIFSMSALDLFASALGAFILITIILLPYYLKVDRVLITENKELKQEIYSQKEKLETKNRELQELQNKLKECENLNKSCQKELAQTFIAVIMKWKTPKVDIDLHVIDPRGREYYYPQASRTHVGSSAKLSIDSTRGPGIEAWEEPSAKVGEYKIYYNYYAQNGGSSAGVDVDCDIYFKNKSITLSTKRLYPKMKGKKLLVATIKVDEEGKIEIIQN